MNEKNALMLNVGVNSLDTLKNLATEVAKSGVFGDISSSQGMMSLVTMRDEGISMAEFKRRYRWIGNELARVPNSLLGDFKRMGGKYEIVQADDDACEMKFTAPDGTPYALRITLQQMIERGVATKSDGKTLKDNWRKFPDDMLFARVCGKALRRIAPELMGGVYTDGEAQDFEPRQPVEIDEGEVQVRIAAAVAAARKDEAAETPPPVVVGAEDYGVCPIAGKLFGRAWREFDTSRLANLLSKRDRFPELADGHVDAINAILAEREADMEREADEAASERAETEGLE